LGIKAVKGLIFSKVKHLSRVPPGFVSPVPPSVSPGTTEGCSACMGTGITHNPKLNVKIVKLNRTDKNDFSIIPFLPSTFDFNLRNNQDLRKQAIYSVSKVGDRIPMIIAIALKSPNYLFSSQIGG
jgi:hypothetical protein